ncbi:MAG: hypothetical protein JWP29_4279 [Rhodoferax sp.]|jgi:hypothetical protein|nr:hypothetical protein [Rhodoferax sp.]
MGIVLFSASALFDGLQGVMGWLGSSRQAQVNLRAAPTTVGAQLNGPRVWHRARRAPLQPDAHFGLRTDVMARVGNAALPAATGLRRAAQAGTVDTLKLATEGLQAVSAATVAWPRDTNLPRMSVRVPCPARAARPLRVVRVLDSATAAGASSAGRMVISGRMADVCAELDRLAALEAAVSPTFSLQ